MLVDFPLSFRNVDLEQKAHVVAEALGAAERIRRAGIGRMAENRWGDGIRPAEPAPGEFAGGRQGLLGAGNPGGREIDDALAQHRPQAEIVYGRGDRILVEVAVGAGGGAREGHLGAGKQSAPAHGFRGNHGAFGRKDVLVQPDRQGEDRRPARARASSADGCGC